ncbi:MAG: Pr6Pr family membrane protein [Proteobacteria bacterium]|nr:Pr6Pr family membrane protein [Pseudomonadota bacterium]
MTPTPLTAVLRLAFGLLALVAIGWQLWLHVGLKFSVPNFFSFFTNLSNLIAAGVLVAGALRQWAGARASPAFETLRAVAATCMLVVGVVFVALLRDVDLGALRPWVNSVLHHVMPVVLVLDWLLWPPRPAVGLRPLRWVLAWAMLYLVYTMLRGAAVGWYPYPFLNPANVGGYGGVAVYAVGIALTFGLAGWMLMALARRRVRPTA